MKAEKTLRTVGATSHAKRERDQHDFYATPRIAVERLLEKCYFDIDNDVLEPCCGQGNISKVLEEWGFHVKSMDLYDHGYGEIGIDFLQYNEPFDGDIVTNPPYKLAQEFIEHGLEIVGPGDKVWVLLRLVFLEGQKRRQLFDRKCLRAVYVFSKRISCYNQGQYENYQGAVAFAWFEFQKGYNKDPVIHWIN